MPSQTASSDSRNDDPVIYFTLIDFLVQIIFCAVILLVVLQHRSHARPDSGRPGWVDDPVTLPLMRDMTPFITIKKDEELRELLQRLKDGDALAQFLEFLRSTPEPFKLMEQCRAHPEACRRLGTMTASELGRLGTGKPPCQTGDPPLFSVDAYDDRLVVTAIPEAGATTLKTHRVALQPQQIIPKADVPAVLSPLSMPGCRYAIRYVKRGDSEDMRHVTEQAVHLSIVRPAAGERR
jgi:hypothetical protein